MDYALELEKRFRDGKTATLSEISRLLGVKKSAKEMNQLFHKLFAERKERFAHLSDEDFYELHRQSTEYEYNLQCLQENASVEFRVFDSNEVDPYRKTKIFGAYVFVEGKQYDLDMSSENLDEMIAYLQKCKKHIDEFNA